MYQSQHLHHQQQLFLQNAQAHLGHQQQTMIGGMTGPNMAQSHQQMEEIEHPGMNDVMCGRGGGTNNHIGNVRFRQLVNGHKLRYLAATKSEKPMVSREVVTIWRGLNPPGRFLKQNPSSDGKSGRWFDVGDKKAREKASQCLRERTPDVAPFMKKLEMQMTLQEEEEDAKKSGTCSKQEESEKKQTAAELNKELLQMQRMATVKAHRALKAFIPPSMVNAPFEAQPDQSQHMPTLRNNIDMYQRGPSPMQNFMAPNLHVPTIPSNDPTLYNEQREILAKEIAQLQQKKLELEAMARQTREQRHVQQNYHQRRQLPPKISNAQVHPHPQANELPPAAVLIDMNPLEMNRIQYQSSRNNGELPITKDDYRQSVRALMGTSKSKSSRSGKSDKSSNKSRNSRNSNRSIGTIENLKAETTSSASNVKVSEKQPNNSSACHPYVEILATSKGSYDRDSEFDSRSRDSWLKGFGNMDDMMSLASGDLASPSSSVNKLLQSEEYEPEPINPSEFNNSVPNGNTNNARKFDNKSLNISSYEYAVLGNMISPANMGQNPAQPGNLQLPDISEDQNNSLNQRPRQRARGASQRSNVSMYSAASSNRPSLNEHKAPSNISMFSDITENSFAKREAMNMKNNRFTKTKSDTSMGMSDNLSNLSDLSEVMGSLEMK